MEVQKKYAGILLLFLAGGLLLMPSTAELHGFDGWHPKHPPAPPEGWPDTAVEKPDFSAGSSWSDSQRDMLYQLRQSSLLLDSSLLDVMQALKMDPALISNRQMLYNNLKSSDTDLGFLQASSEADVPAEQMQSAAKRLDFEQAAKLAEAAVKALPDEANNGNAVEAIGIPGLLSFLAFNDPNAEVKGLLDFKPEDRPPVVVGVVHWMESFSVW